MRNMDDETQLKVRKFLKRLGISSQQELNQFIENNPDVQDLSIKVSFEINDKNVFEGNSSYVLVAKKPLIKASFINLKDEIKECLNKLWLIKFLKI